MLVLRTAWLSDDALISLRTVLNVTHGYGLTFNVAERVQTFTHPLWLLMVTALYGVIGNVYYATFVAGIATSIVAFWLVLRGAATPVQAWIAAGLMFASRAFIDFSTSGLENPLSHLLIVPLVVVALDERLRRERVLVLVGILTSLLYLTRPDNVIIALPLLVRACVRVRAPRAILRGLALGVVPAAAWTLFSLVYYGFPFPNTAYAKLATGLGRSETLRQGTLYLIDSVGRDPLTMTAIIAGAVLAFGRGLSGARALATGVLLHLGYIVWIGGDFMSGRFLTLPFVASVIIISRLSRAELREWMAASALLAIAGASSLLSVTGLTDRADNEIRTNGVVNERAIYFKTQSLVFASRNTFREPDWPTRGEEIHHYTVLPTCGLLGAGGLAWPPRVHLLDECALSDPLLARLPAAWKQDWRIGHFRRMVPDQYVESLGSGGNSISDRALAQYYDEIRLVTRSRRLFSSARWRAIWHLNTGASDHLINQPFYRYQGELATLDDLAAPKPDGTPFDAPGVRIIKENLAVSVEPRAGRRYLDISLDPGNGYLLTFIKGRNVMSELEVGPIPDYRRKPGLTTYNVDLPPRATTAGFDTIVVVPRGDGSPYAIGHLLLDGYAPTDPELQRRVALR